MDLLVLLVPPVIVIAGAILTATRGRASVVLLIGMIACITSLLVNTVGLIFSLAVIIRGEPLRRPMRATPIEDRANEDDPYRGDYIDSKAS